jgi:Uma2 family endonuclease
MVLAQPEIQSKPQPKIQSEKLSLEDFLKLPETKPASEYIDGHIIQKLMPQGKHSRIQGKFLLAINAIVEQQKIGSAFPELRCTFGGRSIVPDIAVLSWNQIPRDENGEIANVVAIAPSWTIEILSPNQTHTRIIKNFLHSFDYGTEMGWLVDPYEKTVFVYIPKQETAVFDEPEALLPVLPLISELKLTIKDLFDWLMI